MDGIAGIVYPDIFQMDEMILPMFEIMKHRGNKGPGIYSHKNVKVGTNCNSHSFNKRNTIVAAIDGSIYNANEIRKSLKKSGFSFQSTNISEIVVFAYECWGENFLDHLNGEFALFILDQTKQKIILARDRIGKKPLYWFQSSNYFIFASELKALLATGLVPQTPATDALSAYLYFGYIPQDLSPIQGVNKLIPGNYLEHYLHGRTQVTPYWSYSNYFEKINNKPQEEILQDLDRQIHRSIQASIPKSASIGCFLSGGLGSASIASYLSEETSRDQLTGFTVGYHGENDDDVKIAKKITDLLEIPHEVYSITQDTFLDHLTKIAWHLDEPLADPNIIATWHLASLASNKTPIVFSGMGSDELFAGHSRYTIEEQGTHPILKFFQKPLTWSSQALIPIFNLLYKPLAFEIMKHLRTNPFQFDYLQKNAIFTESEMADASPKLKGIFDPEIFLHKFQNLSRIRSNVASYLYFDVKTRLPDCYLLQFERLTAAFSLNWKVPFLDRSLVEYLAGLPEPEYLKESEVGSTLKALMKDAFPSEVLRRPKRTRKLFLKNWMESSELHYFFETLTRGILVETGLISKLWLKKKIQDLGKKPIAYKHLWAVLMLEVWFQLYINQPITFTPPEKSLEILLKYQRD